MVNVNVIIIFRRFIFVNVKHLQKYHLRVKQNTKISLTKNYWIMVVLAATINTDCSHQGVKLGR